jgi:N-acylneuraminate cytidylyltransferase
MKILCLILARGGSVRIPKKNIKKLGRYPLIYYTIQAAKKSKYINRIIVSTNDKEIARIAKKYGAEVPFYRPKEISRADSTELEAFEHALNWLKENEEYVPDLIVKLFPTSPFRTVESIDKAIKLMLANPQADSVRSVRLCSEHPYKMWVIKDSRMRSFIPVEQKPKEAHTLSYQVLPKVYIQNACIDVTKPSNIWNKKSITGTEIIPFVMDEIESIDINTPLDFVVAEIILKKGLHSKRKS